MPDQLLFYKPKSLNLQTILPNLPSKEIDNIYYFIHLLYLQSLNKKNKSDFIQLKSTYLRKINRNYKKHINLLLLAGIVLCDKFYIRGKKCFGYKLSELYLNQDINSFICKNIRLINKIQKLSPEISPENKVHEFLIKQLQKVKINEEKLKKINLKKAHHKLAVDRIENKQWSFKCDKNKRVHTNITNLPKELRKILYVNNNQNINHLDVVCCSSVCLSYVLQQIIELNVQIAEQYDHSCNPKLMNHELIKLYNTSMLLYSYCTPPTLYKKVDLTIFEQIVLKKASDIISSNKLINYLNNNISISNYSYFLLYSPLRCTKFLNELKTELDEFSYLASSGTIYDECAKRLKISNRKNIKRIIFCGIFSKGDYNSKFNMLFPKINSLLNFIKIDDYHIVADVLQRLESLIVIENTCNRIMSELPEIEFLGTIHDSLLTTGTHCDYVKNVLLEEFGKYNLNPKIRIE